MPPVKDNKLTRALPIIMLILEVLILILEIQETLP